MFIGNHSHGVLHSHILQITLDDYVLVSHSLMILTFNVSIKILFIWHFWKLLHAFCAKSHISHYSYTCDCCSVKRWTCTCWFRFTMNICKNLPKEQGCGAGANICAVKKDGKKHPIALTTTLRPYMSGRPAYG